MRYTLRLIIIIFVGVSLILISFSNSLTFTEIEDDLAISPNPVNMKIRSNLYFVFGDSLVSETRNVVVENKDLVTALAKELIRGPKNLSYGSALENSELFISAETEKSTVFINLKPKFRDEDFMQSDKKELYIWSIVNTFTELEDIYQVQFLFDGSRVFDKVGGYSLYDPLQRDERYIFSNAQQPSDAVEAFLDNVSSGRYDLAYDVLDDESKLTLSFVEFKEFMSGYMDSFKDYKRSLLFTQDVEEYWSVYVKYELITGSGNPGQQSEIFDIWQLSKVDEQWKINIIEKLQAPEEPLIE